MTHFLLPAFITSALHAGLSSSLSLIIINISSAAWTAFELDSAPLPLVTASSARPYTCCWAACPATHGSVSAFHSGMQVTGFAEKVAFDLN
jgi:hypothetical protein